MIQRIQTIFLFLAGLMLIIYPWLPDVEINNETLNALQIPLLAAAAFISAFIAFMSIFLYKNRPNQRLWSLVSILLILVTIGLHFYYEYSDGDFIFNYGFITLPLAIVFCYLAARYILKDEKLVRSMDRLR
ncbi:MAG: DUF4293 domain-containing protein [Chitinophagales bacterium]|nr:DUF4293 domain-containing protein [Bacteroidota bacterium]MCB9042617.1 DUF4293 domain-containing protein [Chitinophagales bacterium]